MAVPGPLAQRRLGRPALLGSPQPDLGYTLISSLLVWPIYRILLRGCTTGLGHVPRIGGLVVVANHGSHLDPPLISHAIGRPVAFMAKEELFRVPLLGPLIKACGAYPVARGASDREALRTASVNFYFIKPVDEDELASAIEQSLQQARNAGDTP